MNSAEMQNCIADRVSHEYNVLTECSELLQSIIIRSIGNIIFQRCRVRQNQVENFNAIGAHSEVEREASEVVVSIVSKIVASDTTLQKLCQPIWNAMIIKITYLNLQNTYV